MHLLLDSLHAFRPVDLINGLVFEFGNAFALLGNIRRLRRDRAVQGVSLKASAFFTAWGAWNVYYYFSLNLPVSWVCGVMMFLGNLTWLSLALYYRRQTISAHGPNVHAA